MLANTSCSWCMGGGADTTRSACEASLGFGPQLSFTQTRFVYISQSPAGVLQRLQLQPQGLAPAKLPARRLLLFLLFFQRRDSNPFATQLNRWPKKEGKKKRRVASVLVSQVRTIISDITKGRGEKKASQVREREGETVETAAN